MAKTKTNWYGRKIPKGGGSLASQIFDAILYANHTGNFPFKHDVIEVVGKNQIRLSRGVMSLNSKGQHWIITVAKE